MAADRVALERETAALREAQVQAKKERVLLGQEQEDWTLAKVMGHRRWWCW